MDATLRYLGPERRAADLGFIPSLNGLRAVSVLLVLFAHFGYAQFVPGGLGVTIFFFISGFLISRLTAAEILKPGGFSLANFYKRRLTRLLPPLLALMLTILFLRLVMGTPINAIAVLASVAFFQNYYNIFSAHVPNPMPTSQLWSLAVEEHFYLFYPLLMGFFLKRHARRLWFITAALMLLALLLRVVYLSSGNFGANYIYYATETRFDSILWGCLLTLTLLLPPAYPALNRILSGSGFLLGSVLIVASLLIRDAYFRESLRYTLQGLGLFLAIGSLLFSPTLKIPQIILNSSPLDWIGRLSYSLYLWHDAVFTHLCKALPNLSPAQNLLFALAGSFAAAAVSYYGIEKPLMGLRQKMRLTAAFKLTA